MEPINTFTVLFRIEVPRRRERSRYLFLASYFAGPLLFVVGAAIWLKDPIVLFIFPVVMLLDIQGIKARLNGVCGIEIRAQKIRYRILKRNDWKCFSLEHLHHVGCYLQLKKGHLSPAVRFFDKDSKPLKDLEFWLNSWDVYKLLSVLHRMGYPVYLAQEEKNIEESLHYWDGDNAK